MRNRSFSRTSLSSSIPNKYQRSNSKVNLTNTYCEEEASLYPRNVYIYIIFTLNSLLDWIVGLMILQNKALGSYSLYLVDERLQSLGSNPYNNPRHNGQSGREYQLKIEGGEMQFEQPYYPECLLGIDDAGEDVYANGE